MARERRFYIYLSLAIAETIALVWFSFLPSVGFIGVGAPLRPGDLEHLAAYSVYGFLLSRVFGFLGKGKKILFTLVLPLMVGSCVGVACETIQLFVPTRVADALDWLIDTLGSLLGAVLASKFKAPSQN